MVVKIIREKYEKLKQTDMRILKRNTGEVAVQLDKLVEKYKKYIEPISFIFWMTPRSNFLVINHMNLFIC